MVNRKSDVGENYYVVSTCMGGSNILSLTLVDSDLARGPLGLDQPLVTNSPDSPGESLTIVREGRIVLTLSYLLTSCAVVFAHWVSLRDRHRNFARIDQAVAAVQWVLVRLQMASFLMSVLALSYPVEGMSTVMR